LEDLRYEKELSDAKADRVSELQDQLIELRQTNRNLEDKIARLCETPFISESFKHHEVQSHYEEVVKERELLLSKVDHLQEAVRTNYSALTTLKHDIVKLRTENQDLIKQNEEMKLKYSELEVNSNVLESKLKLYSGDDCIDLESLERALTLVRRKSDALERLPFLETVNDNQENMLTFPGVRRKLEETQIVNIKLSEEIDKLENMLKLQTNINRDLHAELELIIRKREADVHDMKTNISDLELLNKKRLEKIQSLEAQLRQYIYTTAKSKGIHIEDSSSKYEQAALADGADVALLNDFIEEKRGNLSSDENLMQIWIRNAEFKDGVVRPGYASFVVVDFYNFESQTTGMHYGSKPSWDCGITFKTSIDDSFIRFLASNVVDLEINVAMAGDYNLLSKISLPLQGLLRMKPSVRFVNHPLLSVENGQIIGHINLDLRLALPISELYRLFLERNPGEKRLIEEISRKRLMDSSNAVEKAKIDSDAALMSTDPAEESRLYNEIEVHIISAKGLPAGRTGKPPSSYVFFQLLSFPDKFSNPAPATSNPEYNEKFSYPFYTNDQSLRLLRTSRLLINVLDMNAEDYGDKEDGMIGNVAISLADLASGQGTTSFYSIKNAGSGNNAGEIEIGLKWKYSFKQPRTLGPRALTNVDVEFLISSFKADGFHLADGIVDYRSFSRFICPPSDISRTIDILRNYAYKVMETKRDQDQYKNSARDIFRVVLSSSTSEALDAKANTNPAYFSKEFVEKLVAIKLEASEKDYANLFNFVDTNTKKSITLDQLISALNMDDVLKLPMSLQVKLRERVIELKSRDIDPIKVFEQSNDSFGAPNQGLIPRLGFKRCLSYLGFTLVDDSDDLYVSEVTGQYQNATQAPNNSKLITANARSVLDDRPESSYELLDDNVLHPVDLDAGRRYFENQQRKIYERKREDLINKSKEARSNGSIVPIIEDVEFTTSYVGKNLLARDSAMSMSPRERLDRRPVVNESFDAEIANSMATKLQSMYRGHNVRKSVKMSSSMEIPNRQLSSTPMKAKIRDESASQNLVTSPSSLLIAEDIIRQCLRSIEGAQAPPNLMSGFATVDKKRTGFVNRAQFAHVIKQYPLLKLYGLELRACMDYFDVEADGSHIAYSKFCEFVNFHLPDYPISVSKLIHQISLAPRHVKALKSMDKTGKGSLSRLDIQRFFTDIGYGQLSTNIITEIAELFETKESGLVNYMNMVEFLSENEVSLSCKELEKQFYSLLASKGDPNDDKVLRHWFKLIERNVSADHGVFSIQQLYQLFRDFQIDVTKPTIMAFFIVLDSDGNGDISYSNFSKWARQYGSGGAVDNNVYFVNLSLSEIQRKASRYMVLVAQSEQGKYLSLSDIQRSFDIYDVRSARSRSLQNSIHRDLFVNALTRAGFLFTESEKRMIVNEFSVNGENVDYRKFLDWSTSSVAQQAVGQAASSTQSLVRFSNDAVNPKRASVAIIKFLESAVQRGIDLLTLFAKYDRGNVGRVTANDFCAVLSDLGVSSISQAEAIDAADRYKAVVGEFVLYRRIVSALISHADEVSGADSIDVVDILRSAMVKSNVNYSRLRDVFEYYDRRQQGKVAENDLQLIFEDCGISLKTKEIDAISSKYSMGVSSGWISYPGLLKALEYRVADKVSSTQDQSAPDEILLKMKKVIEDQINRGIDFRVDFDRCDETFVGSIRKSDFFELLQDQLKAKLTAREVEFIEKKYADPKDHRRIVHAMFFYDMHPRYQETNTSHNGYARHIIEVAENLRNKIRRRVDHTNPIELKKPYRHFSRNKHHQNKVILRDFSIAIRELGIKLPSDHEEAVFDMICVSKSIDEEIGKYFDVSDFIVFVCDPYHQDVVWKFRRNISLSSISHREIEDSLRAVDNNRSGLISSKQLQKALNSCNVSLSESDCRRLVLRFDLEFEERLQIDFFMNFLTGNISTVTSMVPASRSSRELSRTEAIEGDDNESASYLSLRRRIEEKLDAGSTSNEVFALFDMSRKNLVDLASLQLGARDLGITLSRSEVRKLLRRLSTLINGPVDKEGFFKALDIDTSSDRIASSTRNRSNDDDRSYRRPRARDCSDNENVNQYSNDRLTTTKREDSEFEELLRSVRSKADRIVDLSGKYPSGNDVLRDAFSLSNRSVGTITLREFNDGLKDVGIRLTRAEVSLIFEVLDPDMVGNISVDSFLKRVYPSNSNPSNQSRRSFSERVPSDELKSVLLKRVDLREFLLAQLSQVERSSNRSVKDLQELLRSADRLRRGRLERGEFGKCLSRFGFAMKTNMERDLLDSFAEDGGRGEIDYEAFIEVLEAELSSQSHVSDALEALKMRIHQELAQEVTSLDSLFERMDRQSHGSLNVDDFEDAFIKFRISLNRDEIKRILQMFSSDGRAIKYREFLRYIGNPARPSQSMREEKRFTSATASSRIVDRDVDELLSKMRSTLIEELGSKATMMTRIKDVFKRIDFNGDSKISERELKAAFDDLRVSDLPNIMSI
jgi:Ca2+-binding EF-hand superfamily protein